MKEELRARLCEERKGEGRADVAQATGATGATGTAEGRA